MPQRKETEVKDEVAVKKPATKAGKPVAAEKPPVDDAANKVEAGKKLVTKSPLQERFKKFLKEVNPKIPDYIHEISQKVMKANDGTGESTELVFVTFALNGENEKDEDLNDAFNVGVIKEVLFHYHTAQDAQKSGGKAEVLEVVTPENTDELHILAYYEV